MSTFTFPDTAEIENENSLRYLMERLNTISHGSTFQDHMLSLKKRLIFVLLCNLDCKYLRVNGTGYDVKYMTYNVLFLKITTGTRKDAKPTLAQFSFGLDDDSYPFPSFKLLQFPNHRYFLIKSNKAQGKSFR